MSEQQQPKLESITQLLTEWHSGDQDALQRLTPLVYAELRRLAQRLFRSESAGHTLQPTALVNEAFEGLVRMDVSWQNREHFFALSARLMRRILVNHANARRAAKRGGGELRVTLNENVATLVESDDNVLALNDSLNELATLDQRRAQVIEMHYFGGLTYTEIATALGLSPSTVHEDLRSARSWLLRRLGKAT
jgi:RNA polymerase sigma factor (TIGR02999 family)